MTGIGRKLTRPTYPQPLPAAAQSPARGRIANAADTSSVVAATRAGRSPERASPEAPRHERGVRVGVVLGQAGTGASAELGEDLVGQLPCKRKQPPTLFALRRPGNRLYCRQAMPE